MLLNEFYGFGGGFPVRVDKVIAIGFDLPTHPKEAQLPPHRIERGITRRGWCVRKSSAVSPFKS